jgi:hypothetical protein
MGVVDLIRTIKSSISEWHDQDLKIFDNTELNNSDLQSTLVKLSYHNYIAWHMIEQYQNTDSDVIKFVYEGGLIHNSSRNFCMQLIDEYYVKVQNQNAESHSEGMGSIFDKLSNDYIKYLHLIENKDERAHLLEKQVAYFENCLEKLDYELKNGKKSIIVFQKFKVNGYNE